MTNSQTCSTELPTSICINLQPAIEEASKSIPPGLNVDFVDLAYTACCIHAHAEEFYSVTDEIADIIECAYSEKFNSLVGAARSDVVATAKHEFQGALESFVQDVKRELEQHQFPILETAGVVYVPDGFIPNTNTLILRQQQELDECRA